MLGRGTDLAPHEHQSEALAVEPAYSVKGIKEPKVSVEKLVSNPRPIGLHYAVRDHFHKILIYYRSYIII
jgi:hypothetical protein